MKRANTRYEYYKMAYYIIINKLRYYMPELKLGQPVPDMQYDQFEKYYLRLGKYLGYPNLLVHDSLTATKDTMMEVDLNNQFVIKAIKRYHKRKFN